MKKQFGLSLIELMISITLGIVLMTGVVQIFLSSKTVFSTQQGISRIQETGRLAMEFIARDVRQAAYYGCVRPTIDVNNMPASNLYNNTLSIGGLHERFWEGIRGYASAAALPHSASTDLGPTIMPLTTPNANILIIRFAEEPGFPISAPNNPGNIFATIPANTTMGININDALIVSDCFKARLIQASGVTAAGANLTINHSGTWGGGVISSENFITGEVMKMKTAVYFLAQGAGGQPSLWQKTNGMDALELLEGVERMRITFAAQPTNVAPNPIYLDASLLTQAQWSQVGSVRIELVVRSLDDNVLETEQPYTFAGAVVNPGDRRMRQVFSSVISIRSR